MVEGKTSIPKLRKCLETFLRVKGIKTKVTLPGSGKTTTWLIELTRSHDEVAEEDANEDEDYKRSTFSAQNLNNIRRWYKMGVPITTLAMRLHFPTP